MDMEEKQIGLSPNSNQDQPLDGAGDEVHAPDMDYGTPDDKSTAAHATASWTHSGCTWEGTAKKAVLCAVIVVVWLVLAIPTVMFYVPPEEPSDSAVALTTTDSATCGETEVYVGDVCREVLQSLQSCLPGDQSGENVSIPASGTHMQGEIESQAQTLVSSLILLQPTQECKDAVVPFLCLYLFKLCSSDVNGTLHQPSSQQCWDISSDTCASEWNLALAYLGKEALPDCDSLPEHNNLLDCQNGTAEANNGSGTVTSVMCSDDFFFDGSGCQPECGEWEEWSSLTVKTIDGIVIVVVSLGVIAAAVTLVVSCVQHKRMLKFPTSIIVYQSIGLFVVGIIILVGYMDRKALFCSSRSLLRSFYNPTAFCTISGVAFTYVLFQLMVWWFCHCVMVFWSIGFPFHYRSYQNTHRIRYIHVAVILAGLILPGVPVGVTFATGEYTLTRFPPIVGLADNKDAPFYSFVLPVSILIAAGVSLLIMVFHEVLKVIQNKDQTRIAQAKILMVLIYHVVLGASTLTAFTVASRNFPLFLDELLKYFICESAGTGEACDRSGFNKYNNTVASTISFVVLALAPVVNLVYVMKFLSMRETCLRWCGRKEKSTSGENISSSTSNSSPNETRVLHMNRLN